jgi:hypothetical protein
MIRTKKERGPLIIDLTGPNGNAFFLLGTAASFSRQIGFDTEAILAEMQSGDYENLVSVFDKYFGAFVILER